jgi:hypothetical protein
MARLDLDGFLGDDSVEVDIPSEKYPTGKTYRFASPNARTGLVLARLANIATRARLGADIGAEAAKLELDDDQERDLIRDVLGATSLIADPPITVSGLDEMLADDVSWVRIQRLNQYLFIRFAMSEDAAEGLKLPGEARVPANRATRRASMRTTTLVKPATPRASHAGSTTRRKAAPKAKKV